MKLLRGFKYRQLHKKFLRLKFLAFGFRTFYISCLSNNLHNNVNNFKERISKFMAYKNKILFLLLICVTGKYKNK